MRKHCSARCTCMDDKLFTVYTKKERKRARQRERERETETETDRDRQRKREKKSKSENGTKDERTALAAWTQGSLRTHSGGQQVIAFQSHGRCRATAWNCGPKGCIGTEQRVCGGWHLHRLGARPGHPDQSLYLWLLVDPEDHDGPASDLPGVQSGLDLQAVPKYDAIADIWHSLGTEE